MDEAEALSQSTNDPRTRGDSHPPQVWCDVSGLCLHSLYAWCALDQSLEQEKNIQACVPAQRGGICRADAAEMAIIPMF